MIWQPLKEDPSLLEVQLSAWVRALIAAHPAGGPEVPAWHSIPMEDGRSAQLRLAVAPQIRTKFGVRAVITYAVTGQVVIGAEGFACQGEGVLDLKTRAVLDVRCTLSPLGPLDLG